MMPEKTSLDSFYAHKFSETPLLPPYEAGGFNVFRLTKLNEGASPAPYARYDFYKIMLIRGRHRCHYAHKSIEINGSTLLFFNPAMPYRFERLDKESTGFFCVFKDLFYIDHLRNGIQDIDMFKRDGRHEFPLSEDQDKEVESFFEKMLHERQSDYRFKYDLLRNHVFELLHFAMKIQPGETLYHHPDTNARLTSIFTEMLERQFPIESTDQFLELRSAIDFAEKLSVHVNHLNRAVKKTTGKTTTEHISQRIAAEATALLKHSDWNISEISDRLGFSNPSHFAYFFKKQTKVTPTSVRSV
ncbi:helix-turn-helix domain-containing protein [Chryseobacterium sp. MYb264]|uniref:helix-turn-helix domain-containing protein n=1 Tax=Chryseobacterium sp. MYb264 TaxID=2745153 RepID=UPI002E12E054|nr:helix-turn-helix domain-containing protein [Chryseobacterium sp. MYb264]